MRSVLVVTLVMLALLGCGTQDPPLDSVDALAMGQRVMDVPTERPAMIVERAPGPLTIDGQMDAAWKKADPVEFVFPWNDVAAEGAQSTKARVLWDDANLYLLYECVDPYLDSEVLDHDGPVYNEDAVEIFATPNPDNVTAYFGYEMNIHGTFLAYMAFEWEAEGIQIATTHDGTLNDHSDTDRGWILEMAIPFENFRHLGGTLPPKEGDVWRWNLNRTKGYDGQFSIWSDTGTDQANFHISDRFGYATFTTNVAD